MTRSRKSFASALALAALLGATVSLTTPAQAQYFGHNKVQYENFDFKVLRTAHFDLYYYPEEQAAADIAARMAERWYARLSTLMHHQLSGRQPLILYATQAQFEQTNVVEGISEGTGGVTEALRRRIVLPTGGTLGDLDHVIGHELTHAFQYDITGVTGRNGASPAAEAMPLWFIEGMAEYMSLGPVAPLTAMWMRGAIQDTAKDTLPTFKQLDDPRYFPYRYGQALLAYVGGTYGDDRIGELLRASGRTRGVDNAIRGVLSLTPDQLVARWHAAIHAEFDSLQATTQQPDRYGPRLVAVNGQNAGLYNLAPSLSPDGSKMMFFSDRGLFSVDLYLADARTGKVERQITRTAVDPHLESLQFISSAGSWSDDGKRFVFAGIEAGRPNLNIYDVDKRKIERDIRLPKLGEILNPTWSPDGQSIAFSAIIGGLSDLFVYDLKTGNLQRLTDDAFSDLQPSWSPDGTRLAFVTDRFTTRMQDLAIGPYSLAILDRRTGQIVQVPGFDGAKHLNPQWTPDGTGLYFVANPSGIPNIYRVRLADGELRQITNLFTGVSGITETSPAISVAARSGRLAYSVFRTNGYELYAMDTPEVLAGQPVPPHRATLAAAALPPVSRESSTLVALLRDPNTGLPADTTFATAPYRPGLSLTAVGQPSLAAGTSEFGTYVGGGLSLFWSDELGNRNLITGLQVNGGIKDITGVVAYQNVGHRLNWGAVLQQVPYLTGAFATGVLDTAGQQLLAEQTLLQRQTNRDAQLFVAYPFNTARRVEFSVGYSNISFDNELRTQAFDPFTGDLIIDEKVDLPAGRALNLGTASAALVYDNSLYGATGPILGQRYRLEATPTIGSLNMVSALVDYRRYIMPARPFTIAARILHYGRYGSDAQDPRLQPLYLGWPGLVRGYSVGSFDVSECHPTAANPTGCPAFDNLLGSRLLIGNLELRFPLLGVLGLGSGYYGALPIDFTIFGDGGVAWNNGQTPSFSSSSGKDRSAVYSAGTGLRMNLFGFAIAELNLVHPFERPGKNWVWELNLQQGF
ncbi:MAG TPA: BamA/TamA family outer membrane protein [Gemmatimonadales bacterium]|nr:BamA/TamA family outer membrane protein [Gemmatimonadales bacterium]